MLVIELHDDQLSNAKGTLIAHIGRRHGSIAYAYQAEMQMQEAQFLPWRRAYLKDVDGTVLCIWARDMQTGELSYLARHPHYDGEWQLPFVTTPDASIAVMAWGPHVKDQASIAGWVAATLRTAATAIVMRSNEIWTAWEPVRGRVQVISRGPQ